MLTHNKIVILYVLTKKIKISRDVFEMLKNFTPFDRKNQNKLSYLYKQSIQNLNFR